MPQRLLRPGLRTSKRYNRCPWFVQSFYSRLIMLVDDHGRYEADVELLRSEAFPYGDPSGNQLPLEAIADGCQQMSAANLVLFYEIDGKKYLQVTRWKERVRSESRYPGPNSAILPTSDSKCQQMIASPPQPQPQPQPTPTPQPARAPVSTLPNSDAQTQRPSADEAGDGTCVRVDLKKIQPNKRVDCNGHGSLELIKQLSTFYGRTDGSAWSYEEEQLAVSVARREHWQSEFELLKWHKSKMPQKRYFPQSIRSLLSGWTEHLDKARLAKRHPSMRGE